MNNKNINLQYDDKRLLNLEEFCQYLGIGKTKAREILNRNSNTFSLRIGNRLYANKKLLDKYIDEQSGIVKRVEKNAIF